MTQQDIKTEITPNIQKPAQQSAGQEAQTALQNAFLPASTAVPTRFERNFRDIVQSAEDVAQAGIRRDGSDAHGQAQGQIGSLIVEARGFERLTNLLANLGQFLCGSFIREK